MSDQKPERPNLEDAVQAGVNNPDFAALFEDATELQSMAASAHEVFETHVNAGFTASQSLYIVAAIFTNNPGMPPQR